MNDLIITLGKEGIRLNDGFTSVANGIIMVLREMLMKGTMMSAYLYIYANWRIYELPWDSLMTWIVVAILVDLAYYWVHRAAHELNILWAAHQVCIFWTFLVQKLVKVQFYWGQYLSHRLVLSS